jgi:hypothetical protein
VPLTRLVLNNEKSRTSFDEYQAVLRRWKAAASKGASTQQAESEDAQDT